MRATIAILTSVCLLTATTLRAQQEDDDSNNSLEQSSEESTAQTTEDSSNSTTQPTNDVGEATQGLIDATSSRDDDPDPSPSPTPEENQEQEQLIIGGLALLVIILAVVAVMAFTRPSAKETKHDAKAHAWLEENREQLRIDLALGMGPTIDDLAATYRVPEERHVEFGDALRFHRGELLDLANAGDARAFLRRVGEIMQSEPSLEADFVRWRMVVGAL